MPTNTDDIVAQFEKLLRAKRGARSGQVESRLLQDRKILSRDYDNQPVAGWEKAAALIGAALSPGSTIASMVLGRPEEESLFDRQIQNPDGSYSYPKVSESVVPKMRKRARAEMRPNPIVQAIQQHFKLGAVKDPANDLVHQKINDRDFLVHATRPKDATWIKDMGGIMPGSRSETLPENVLKDPLIRQGIKSGKLELYRDSLTGRMRISRQADGHEYEVHPKQLSGIAGTDEKNAPGVSLSRQMVVPDLNRDKNYRFLLDPKSRKTFATSEAGYKKPHTYEYSPENYDVFESEQRTFGTPYPVKVGNRATVAREPKGPTEEHVRPGEENSYRATMGNEMFRHVRERVGEMFGGKEYQRYKSLKREQSRLDSQLSILSFQAQRLQNIPEDLHTQWNNIASDLQKVQKEIYSLNLPDYLKY